VGVAAPSLAQVGAPQHAPSPASSQLLRKLPRYYVALTPFGKSSPAIKDELLVKSTLTGKTLATVRPPKPYWTFGEIAGAAHGRTFVLAAETTPVNDINSPTKFLLGRFHPSTGAVTLKTLDVPEVRLAQLLTGMALSPNGKKFATSVLTGKNRDISRVSVYSLASGSVRSWQNTGTLGYGPYDPSSISLSRNGTLAFNWVGLKPSNGVYLLNPRAAAGSLLAHSQFKVGAIGKVWNFNDGGVLTPDGKTIVAPLWKPSAAPPGEGEFQEYSAATGAPVKVLDRTPYIPDMVFWTNSSGSVLVVRDQAKSGGRAIIGVVCGRQFVPLPGAPAVGTVTF
jgi:hypothetical protein